MTIAPTLHRKEEKIPITARRPVNPTGIHGQTSKGLPARNPAEMKWKTATSASPGLPKYREMTAAGRKVWITTGGQSQLPATTGTLKTTAATVLPVALTTAAAMNAVTVPPVALTTAAAITGAIVQAGIAVEATTPAAAAVAVSTVVLPGVLPAAVVDPPAVLPADREVAGAIKKTTERILSFYL